MIQRYIKLVPVIFLAICSFITVVTAIQGNIILDSESYDFAPTAKHYCSFPILALATLSFFRFRGFYKYMLAAILLLTLFNIISFTPTQHSFNIGYEDSQIRLNLVALAFGLLVYLTNTDQINSAVLAALKPSEGKARQQELIVIEEFKYRFARKTSEELTRIISANALVPAAIAAARHLLKDRQ
ncbi:hypothetical protein [Hymenobacter sp. UYCo722]|uniref:hypothetical protein n=1 Tax=Hymenobacter sp. UYCo722 TaxID=3156335 RepID=UPI00339845DC